MCYEEKDRHGFYTTLTWLLLMFLLVSVFIIGVVEGGKFLGLSTAVASAAPVLALFVIAASSAFSSREGVF
ncbi:MAG: hypothetical protein ACKOW9_05335 [Candidatus Paceibacterota bacterium]